MADGIGDWPRHKPVSAPVRKRNVEKSQGLSRNLGRVQKYRDLAAGKKAAKTRGFGNLAEATSRNIENVRQRWAACVYRPGPKNVPLPVRFA